MKACSLVVLLLGAYAGSALAQSERLYRYAAPAIATKQGIVIIDASNLLESGSTDSATRVFGFPGKRMGLENVGDPRPFGLSGLDRDALNSRAWGMSVGLQSGPLSLRVAHQNKNVAKVAPAMPLGTRTDAKNTVIAADVDLGLVKAYTAYSANRGWGSSPLWNPDNPYGAGMATSPSTDSRDVLVGVAVPMGRTTLLASFVRKNDRDLANRDVDQMAFGGTYTLSRSTDFYTAYSRTQTRAIAGVPVISTRGSSALNVGMRHSF
ncbi:MAG: porin [Massilia sp.]